MKITDINKIDTNMLKSIKITKILVRASSGANVEQCILDSIVLAAKENKNVDLMHNDKLFEIDLELIYNAVKGIEQLKHID